VRVADHEVFTSRGAGVTVTIIKAALFDVANLVTDYVTEHIVSASREALFSAIISVIAALRNIADFIAGIVAYHVFRASRGAIIYDVAVSIVKVACSYVAFRFAEVVAGHEFLTSRGAFVTVTKIKSTLSDVANGVTDVVTEQSVRASRVALFSTAIISVIAALRNITDFIAGIVVYHVFRASRVALHDVAVSIVEVAWSYVAFRFADSVAGHEFCTSRGAFGTVTIIKGTLSDVANGVTDVVTEQRVRASREALFRGTITAVMVTHWYITDGVTVTVA